jgi:hypothetical protein
VNLITHKNQPVTHFSHTYYRKEKGSKCMAMNLAESEIQGSNDTSVFMKVSESYEISTDQDYFIVSLGGTSATYCTCQH